jgi:hypothetical protein
MEGKETMAVSESGKTRQDSYCPYFGLYFWRGPPGDLVLGCSKRSRADPENPWPFFVSVSSECAFGDAHPGREETDGQTVFTEKKEEQ